MAEAKPELEPESSAKAYFRLAPKSGKRAAALIKEQVSEKEAEAVFDVWNAQEDKAHFMDVYSAMSSLYFRLGNEKKGLEFAVLTGWEQAHTGEDFRAPPLGEHE